MPNTYTQIYIHLVFAVLHRDALISQEWEQELYKYIGGILHQRKHRLIAINGAGDHVHLLVSINPNEALSVMVKNVKQYSALWVNKNHKCPFHFEWQTGYGAFSYTQSSLQNVINYIANQKVHHQKHKFTDEYKLMLQRFEIGYDDRYLLSDPL
jgi:REP element-mobilizing transposase RayT